MPTDGRALGFIRADISGSRIERDKGEIRLCADRDQLELAHILVVRANHSAPIFPLLEAARHYDVAAIIVPALVHVHAWRRGVTEQWALHDAETGAQRAQGHDWGSQLPPRQIHPLLP